MAKKDYGQEFSTLTELGFFRATGAWYGLLSTTPFAEPDQRRLFHVGEKFIFATDSRGYYWFAPHEALEPQCVVISQLVSSLGYSSQMLDLPDLTPLVVKRLWPWVKTAS